MKLCRKDISKRINKSKKISGSLEVLAQNIDGTTLNCCIVCGQYWQYNVAWNWKGRFFYCKVPKISVEEWEQKQFVSPSDIMIYNSLMQDYFDNNRLIDSDTICKKDNCFNNALDKNVLCKEHFILNLQKMSILPQKPEGRWFKPYE